MLADLHVTLIQTDLCWCDAEANLERLEEKLDRTSHRTDLIVLPEMFTTGFMMAPEDYAETQDGPTLSWMKQQAKRRNAALVGSFATQSELGYTNRLWFVRPDGGVEYYDKRHLFTMGDEAAHYRPGKERVVVSWRGWNILLTVCYDLRFPVFCRNLQDYDVMLCVANWPAVRRQAWMSLLHARAIENQSYVVGVNRVGTEPSGISYSGDTMLVDYQGYAQAQAEEGSELVITEVLRGEGLVEFRRGFDALADADHFILGD